MVQRSGIDTIKYHTLQQVILQTVKDPYGMPHNAAFHRGDPL